MVFLLHIVELLRDVQSQRRSNGGNSVTQTKGQVTLSEGAPLTVNCSYETTGYPTLFWYVQYPGEGPQLLLKAATANGNGSSKGFVATYRKQPNAFHLEKASVRQSDSAMYYCALSDTGHGFTRIQGPMASPGPGTQPHPDLGAHGLARTRDLASSGPRGTWPHPDPGARGLSQTQGRLLVRGAAPLARLDAGLRGWGA
ncbi:hypothetical protein QTO34_019494 [Cnephaeus nilssonii]|uniref:Ig-like domain-containing protein n=1 Tax=Cnephaeus nilssonii TaxID=3371016 RepID=A0AA40LMR4_CNENI|nr:hypothetical protein QTO34_019494 [Eptesicus nilssonii]